MPQIRINASDDLRTEWGMYKALVEKARGKKPTNDEVLESLFELTELRGLELDEALEKVEAELGDD